ncbi:MAG: YigZ family protein [Bacilli bacterium]|nr:YigZ family protein [Bacilli bacterium]
MKTIKDNIKNELVIKNSKFITLLLKIDSSNIKDILEKIKKEYPKATHYCYAYIYNEIKHSSDDNEPTGTAGLPMLNVLEHENLNKILCIVIRYFGGIKLGAGGLIRAYTKSVTEVLKEANFLDLEKGYKINIEFSYNLEKQVNYLLKDYKIIDKKFDKTISYLVEIPENFLNKLYNYNYQIIEEIYIKKN